MTELESQLINTLLEPFMTDRHTMTAEEVRKYWELALPAYHEAMLIGESNE